MQAYQAIKHEKTVFSDRYRVNLHKKQQKMRRNAKKTQANAQNRNKFVRLITIPYRALIKARDFYVQSMTSCAGGVSYGGATHVDLPRSFSVSSSRANDNEDFRELLRAASARSLGNGISRIELEILLRQQSARQAAAVSAATGGRLGMRSVSVGMGRIDEEKDCEEFDENVDDTPLKVKNKNSLMYPRSKSYAVSNNNENLAV